MKTALITGASQGIGAACARRFASAGYAVMIQYHTHEKEAEMLCREIRSAGGKAAIFGADISSKEQAEALVHKTLQDFGGIDVLVNNAGIALNKMFCDTTDEDWIRILSVNLMGSIYLARAVLPCMVHKKQGHIVNVSSIWGMVGASCEVAYSASKAAIIGFTKALAKELGPSGILVNCVAPGVIDTPMNAALDEETLQALKEETPLMKLGTPEDVAEAVFFLANEQNRFITGQILSPGGGIVM